MADKFNPEIIDDVLEEGNIKKIPVGGTSSKRSELLSSCRRWAEQVLAQIYIPVLDFEMALEIWESSICKLGSPCQRTH